MTNPFASNGSNAMPEMVCYIRLRVVEFGLSNFLV